MREKGKFWQSVEKCGGSPPISLEDMIDIRSRGEKDVPDATINRNDCDYRCDSIAEKAHGATSVTGREH